MVHFTNWVALAVFVSHVSTASFRTGQAPLSHPQTFIQKSIFGQRRDVVIDSHDDFTINDDFNENTPYEDIATFAHLNWTNCFSPDNDGVFDIGIVGAPFDLGVTYRPGARFGPSGARMGARRLAPSMGYRLVTVFGGLSENMFAYKKITLPALRSLHPTWGKVAVLHFDSHLDSWDPKKLGGGLSKYAEVTHGSLLHLSREEGLLSGNNNMHLGSRSMLFDKDYDLDNDARCGFSYIRARELDVIGLDAVIERILKTVVDQFVYLRVDIDVLDPAFAPATGTIEPGGWTTRELLQILNGLSRAGVKIIGADVVEFSPVYDDAAERTAVAVGQIVYEIFQWMIRVPVGHVE
ncbi:Arginase/deacetylase [Aspergillus ruber CBS 135680]|uniref:Arginase/deacetylase n=1 Tax=Aspergillus ruber (strain CBS 135680) TaxID=1388766 RepID=A0A017S9M1_ASPRC|nr:Arginase/deacetylase [Aspergillus ruber CBS 135680]EYE92890.1 Arginase/deacetylase [Aspergillus ruber CBS 135680]